LIDLLKIPNKSIFFDKPLINMRVFPLRAFTLASSRKRLVNMIAGRELVMLM